MVGLHFELSENKADFLLTYNSLDLEHEVFLENSLLLCLKMLFKDVL